VPDTVIYMTEDDQERFIQFALNAGAWLIADMNYPEPKAIRVDSMDRYKHCRLKMVSKFYIQRQDFTQSPLVFKHIEKNGAHIYYISQRQGGPNIDFSGGGTYEKDGHRYIRPGGYGYYPTYWDTLLDKNQTAPKALKEFYSYLKQHLFQCAARLGNTKTKPWVLSFAILAMQRGARLGGFENHTVADLELEKSLDIKTNQY
jgi:hypothetical protein